MVDGHFLLMADERRALRPPDRVTAGV